MRVATLCGLCMTLALLVTSSPIAKDTELIDGRKTTIALAIAHQLAGLIPNETVKELINTILEALGEEQLDYWGEVKDEVMAMVGDYINAHNMHQVEVYQEDLQMLMDRYNQAPVESDSYPDKNQQAAALSVSIISHRYLVEAAEMPESMILHFEDISSIHIIVLKDAAETYSFEGLPPSRWWVDLDEELDHYIMYGKNLKVDLKNWRLNKVTCEKNYADGSCTNWEWTGVECYDTFIARDEVTGEESSCTQVHGTQDCESHCDIFGQHKENEVDLFISAKVLDVIDAWEKLKEIASANAQIASRLYDPSRSH